MIKVCGIYRILNRLNGKCYVGQSLDIEARWLDHTDQLKRNWHHSIKLQRAWNKYGKEAFIFEVLQECSEDQLDYLEAFWMTRLDAVDNGYNVIKIYLEDGRIHHQHSEETKRKISKSLKGRTLADTSYLKGKIFSKEHCKKISLANKGMKKSEETKRKISEANLGKTCTLESRRKMSLAQAGKVLSIEHRLKIGIASKGRKHSEETKQYLSKLAKVRIRTLEHEMKLSNARKAKAGCRISEEHKQKIRNTWANKSEYERKLIVQARKKAFYSAEVRLRISLANTGKVVSRATREKLSKSQLGRPKSEETKRKISEANLGKTRTFSEEHLRKLREANKLAGAKRRLKNSGGANAI